MPDTTPPPSPPARRRFRFGLRELLALMLVAAVASANVAYLVRALNGGGRTEQVAFVLMVLISPLCLLTVVRLLMLRPGRTRS